MKAANDKPKSTVKRRIRNMTTRKVEELRFVECVVAISCLCMPLLNTSYADANLTTIEDGALADSLVAYWSFNGNANDSSGNGHNGVVVGAALTADRNGAENKAYWFDGTNDYIWAANDGTLCPTSFTFSAWIRVDRVGQQSGALMGVQENLKGYGFACGKAWGNDVLAMIGKGGSFWSGSFYTQTPGQWSFYALSLDADGNQRLYVNGQMVGDALTNVHMVQTMANMIIGRHYANTGEGWWFCGAIDEIRLYGRALSAEEVNVLYGEEILEAPVDVLATDGSYIDKVRITWDSVINATGYEVWRAAVNALGLASKLGDTAASS